MTGKLFQFRSIAAGIVKATPSCRGDVNGGCGSRERERETEKEGGGGGWRWTERLRERKRDREINLVAHRSSEIGQRERQGGKRVKKGK